MSESSPLRALAEPSPDVSLREKAATTCAWCKQQLHDHARDCAGVRNGMMRRPDSWGPPMLLEEIQQYVGIAEEFSETFIRLNLTDARAVIAALSRVERAEADSKRQLTEADLREPLEWALNQAWSDFVGDTGCYPDCIQVERSRRGVFVSANFGVSSFAPSAAGWLAMKLNEARVAVPTPEAPNAL